MIKFLTEFNIKTNNDYSYLSVSNADLNISKKTINIDFLIPYHIFDKAFTVKDKERINKCLSEILPSDFKIYTNFKKAYCDENIALEAIISFINSYKPVLLLFLKKEDIKINLSINDLKITINIEPSFEKSVRENNLTSELCEYLSHRFCEKIEVDLFIYEKDREIINKDKSVEEENLISVSSNSINVKNTDILIGGEIVSVPVKISSVTNACESQTICGKITQFDTKISKKTNKPFYIIEINDTTGYFEIKSFSKTEEPSKIANLTIGDEIIATGSIVFDSFSKRLNMLTKKVSKCVIDYTSIKNVKNYKKLLPYYVKINPTKYIESTQCALFNDNKKISNYLLNKSFVLFDFETTGLGEDDEIIDIGAYKLVNGEITEEFNSLIKPEKMIPPEVIKITGIDNKTVENAPKIEEVIGDFLKFCEGSELISYNIKFDSLYLRKAAEKNRYEIKNSMSCALEMSRKYIKSSNHKLESVCEFLGIELVNAHRAYADALALTKVFMELAKYLEKAS